MSKSYGEGEKGGGLDLVWGTTLIGERIKRTARQTNHMLVTGALPGARKVAGRWVITEQALRALFEDKREVA